MPSLKGGGQLSPRRKGNVYLVNEWPLLPSMITQSQLMWLSKQSFRLWVFQTENMTSMCLILRKKSKFHFKFVRCLEHYRHTLCMPLPTFSQSFTCRHILIPVFFLSAYIYALNYIMFSYVCKIYTIGAVMLKSFES